MRMALPHNKLTLQSTSSSNWIRPNNLFCTAHSLNAFTSVIQQPDSIPLVLIISPYYIL
ncbi:hypothetical protein CY34DRAFT_75186 [Suillus luteus UH-Slu-Lm8-n1]|uniref:Uncharacterized protein n=1 Tax=Suillus luteus UH-Slu-Lm8-n1 TaxID=930992 RepID=A0A0D0BV36_9AGAM|nr:hypothetical protein CY34DRAFT_75186 [Suillus luteus UH-Slu-Lm8-n1]